VGLLEDVDRGSEGDVVVATEDAGDVVGEGGIGDGARGEDGEEGDVQVLDCMDIVMHDIPCACMGTLKAIGRGKLLRLMKLSHISPTSSAGDSLKR
jgi:hypothetical protein